MARWSGTSGAELCHEVALVQRLAPGLAISLPPGKPNTRRTIEMAASLLSQDVGRGMEFIRQTYRAFWCQWQDLSDPMVLTRLAKAIEGEPARTDPGDASRV
jgi:2-hydroxychromene-2-carboxylate isomerase